MPENAGCCTTSRGGYGLRVLPFILAVIFCSLPLAVMGQSRNFLACKPVTFEISPVFPPLVLYGALKQDLPPPIPTPFPVAFKIGAAVSPRLKFAAGIDATFPRLSIAPHFATRVDFDAIFSANFGGVTTLFPLTAGQVYRVALPVTGQSLYIGAGIGPYFGEVTRFGGKIYAGGNLSSRIGAEAALHFTGYGDPTVTAALRFGL